MIFGLERSFLKEADAACVRASAASEMRAKCLAAKEGETVYEENTKGMTSLLTAAFARLPRFPPAEAWRTNLPKPPRRRIPSRPRRRGRRSWTRKQWRQSTRFIPARLTARGSGVNLAQGSSYTLSRAPSAQYPDTEGKKLTDGVTNEAFSKTGWVGFEGVSALTVDLDLGESIENVAELDVGFLRMAEYGIELPERVVFSVSDDGGTYVAVGEMLAPQGVAATIKKTYAAVLPGRFGRAMSEWR